MTRRVLVVDDDAAVRDALSQTLELADLDPVTAGSFVVARDVISREFDGVVVSDMRMPGRDGFHLLTHTQQVDADLPVILLTGEGDIPMAVQAMGQGAFDFLEKPCAPKELLAVIERALKTRALVLENRALKQQLETGDPAARMLFGASVAAEGLRKTVREVSRAGARAGAEVFVTGPAGSGISKVAEVIHLCSARSKEPFVKRAGAGLTREALGQAVEAAGNGALFIDEVQMMAMDAQLMLLDLLEAKGAVRIILGSTVDVQQDVAQGRFHAELFYRLDPMKLRIPSLSERPEDIPVMFRQYVAQAAEQSGLAVPEIPAEVIASLMARDWPGNARALMSVAMRFVLGLGVNLGEVEAGQSGVSLSEQMAQVERALIIEALRRTGGQATQAALDLQLPRKTFYDKLSKHGLRPEAFRD